MHGQINEQEAPIRLSDRHGGETCFKSVREESSLQRPVTLKSSSKFLFLPQQQQRPRGSNNRMGCFNGKHHSQPACQLDPEVTWRQVDWMGLDGVSRAGMNALKIAWA